MTHTGNIRRKQSSAVQCLRVMAAHVKENVSWVISLGNNSTRVSLGVRGFITQLIRRHWQMIVLFSKAQKMPPMLICGFILSKMLPGFIVSEAAHCFSLLVWQFLQLDKNTCEVSHLLLLFKIFSNMIFPLVPHACAQVSNYVWPMSSVFHTELDFTCCQICSV